MHPILVLPTELKIAILSHLGSKDVRSLRFLSREWALAGTSALFQDGIFTIRPHLDDMSRLKAVCNHPEIAKAITRLEIYPGDMVADQFVSSILREMSLTPPQKRRARRLVEQTFNSRQAERHCNQKILEYCLARLPNLNCLEVSSMLFPFKDCNHDLHFIWENMQRHHGLHMTRFLDPSIQTIRYGDILASVANSGAPIEKIMLDPIPVNFIAQIMKVESSNGQKKIHIPLEDSKKKTLRRIKELAISYTGHGAIYNNLQLANALGCFLGAFRNLTKLDLSWHLEEIVPNAFLERWEDSLAKQVFPYLEYIAVRQLQILDTKLLPWLFKHRKTLRHLKIGRDGCEIDRGSNRTARNFCTALRDNLKLSSFYYFHHYYDYERNFDYLAKAKTTAQDSRLLELYVTRQCPWPMVNDDPFPSGWQPRFVGTGIEFKDMTIEQKTDLLGDDWETEREQESDESDDSDDSDDLHDLDGFGDPYDTSSFSEDSDITMEMGYGIENYSMEGENYIELEDEWESV